ncbi:MAG TPA: hypothetical protein VNJ54_15135 [Plantibacter sp.]|uniref:hypothetical protein n=1 Tax=Plantibacter sp. TaxID=1871045 RepID=UPI002CB927D8|nr:hypothetical protein [Plantibacter sp.]
MSIEIMEAGASLADLEVVISRGMSSFVEVGNALATIKREMRYVEAGFDSFEAYCKQRWDMSRDHADNTIGAARVTTIVGTHGLPAPATEWVARPLMRLMNEEGYFDPSTKELRYPEKAEAAVIAAWSAAVEQHHDTAKPITGTAVRKIIGYASGVTGKPGWHELLGMVGDSLTYAAKRMNKAEDAIGEYEPSDAIKEKALDYARRAETLASRLRTLADVEAAA